MRVFRRFKGSLVETPKSMQFALQRHHIFCLYLLVGIISQDVLELTEFSKIQFKGFGLNVFMILDKV